MARWMIAPGIGVLVAGMVTLGLAVYLNNWLLFVYGGIIPIAGFVLLGVGGELRIVGTFLLVLGILGIVLSVPDYSVPGRPGGWLQSLLFGGMMSNPLGYLISWGYWWGPFFIAIGLISLVVAWQSRRPSPTS